MYEQKYITFMVRETKPILDITYRNEYKILGT